MGELAPYERSHIDTRREPWAVVVEMLGTRKVNGRSDQQSTPLTLTILSTRGLLGFRYQFPYRHARMGVMNSDSMVIIRSPGTYPDAVRRRSWHGKLD